MGKIRVLIADNHSVVRQGLRKVLESNSDIEIAGEAADGASAIESAKRLRPTVVVIDIGLPGVNYVDAISHIAKSGTQAPAVLILSMHADEAQVRRGLKAGAKGYLEKDSEDVELITAVQSLARGGSYFSPEVSKLLLCSYLGAKADAGDEALSRLTGREREVVQLISEGKTNREIARMLSRSINTIESHRKHAMEKLNLHNTAEIVRFAVRKGIVR